MDLQSLFGLVISILQELGVWSYITLAVQAILVLTVTSYMIRMFRG